MMSPILIVSLSTLFITAQYIIKKFTIEGDSFDPPYKSVFAETFRSLNRNPKLLRQCH